MRLQLVIALFVCVPLSALAQTPQSVQQSQQQPNVVLSSFQALANVLRNPDAPPPQPLPSVTSEPLSLPNAIPPSTVGPPAQSQSR